MAKKLTVEQAAKKMAKKNAESLGTVSRVLWFPDEKEVRLIFLDEVALLLESKQVQPYYFSPVGGMPYVLSLALLRPEQKKGARLPKGWGGWKRGVVVYEKG